MTSDRIWCNAPMGATAEWDADIIEEREMSLFPGLQLRRY